MEQPKHHEIIRPIKEIAQGIGNFVLDKILPTEIFDHFVQGTQVEAANRAPTYTQFPLSYDSEGNWHNPDGLDI